MTSRKQAAWPPLEPGGNSASTGPELVLLRMGEAFRKTGRTDFVALAIEECHRGRIPPPLWLVEAVNATLYPPKRGKGQPPKKFFPEKTARWRAVKTIMEEEGCNKPQAIKFAIDRSAASTNDVRRWREDYDEVQEAWEELQMDAYESFQPSDTKRLR